MQSMGFGIDQRTACPLPSGALGWWYRASCFAYCVAGALLLARTEPVRRHMPVFPWEAIGASVMVQGVLSYMGDVATWEEESVWKRADVFLASVNTCLQAVIIALSMAGYSTFPLSAMATLTAGLVLSLFARVQARQAVRRGDMRDFFVWHGWWHVLLPSGAIAAQLLCPDERQPSCS